VLQVVCPACGAKLNIRDDFKGKRINCGGCGKKFAIASQDVPVVAPTQVDPSVSPPTAPPDPQLVPLIRTHSSSYRSRLRGTSLFQKTLSILLHLTVPLATLYAGYHLYLVSQHRLKQPAPQVVRVEPPQRGKMPKRIKLEPRTIQQDYLAPSVAPKMEPKLSTSPLPVFPSQVGLPTTKNTDIRTLISELQDTSFVFISNEAKLVHTNNKLLWREDESDEPLLVGGMMLKEGEIVFRWMPGVSQEAEFAVRNSVIKLMQGGSELAAVALRQPKNCRAHGNQPQKERPVRCGRHSMLSLPSGSSF